MGEQPANGAGYSEKSEAAFRTISEVGTLLDIPLHVLRFWESKFSQLRPLKRGGGRRYYRPEDIVLLRRIRDLLYLEGMTIKGVQKLFRDHGVKNVVGGESGPSTSVKEDTSARDSVRGVEEAVLLHELIGMRDILRNALESRRS